MKRKGIKINIIAHCAGSAKEAGSYANRQIENVKLFWKLYFKSAGADLKDQGYSDSCLGGVPGFIQEPLINALSKIAQWKGTDKELKGFFE